MSKISNKVSGKVVFQELETGFWSIVGTDGEKYFPVNMPNQLKINGCKVSISFEQSQAISIFMWGTPIRIISFHTLSPC